MEKKPVLELVARLCSTLAAEKIDYCHWKSNANLDRSANGDNDLDLLVARAHVQKFTEILFRLGFKQAYDAPDLQMPGVLDFYGYDPAADRFAHVHAHYQLVFGHDATKNYHLPIEKEYLAACTQGELFKVPEPEFELIMLIVRMMVKGSTWEMVLLRQTGISSDARQEWDYLQERISPARLAEILDKLLPWLGRPFFEDCMRALKPGSSLLFRLRTGEELRRRLSAHARRSTTLDIWLKLWRRVAQGVQHRFLGRSFKKRLSNGGALIAIVGGDGSGKTTAIKSISAWLSEEFYLRKIHMGKPEWAFTTIVIRAFLKIGRTLGFYPFSNENSEFTVYTDDPAYPGLPTLIREVLTGRDRYLTYAAARRFTTNGGLVVSDRFHLPPIKYMDGPQVERLTATVPSNWFIRLLIKLEKQYYEPIMYPDLLIVLRVDPEISVQRKTDETAESVRARNGEMWRLDWSQTPACLIDASKSKDEVLADLKALVWSHL
jgi:thymidylate kinase